MDAKTRFERTREAIPRLNDIKLALMYDGDDWKPQTTRTRTDTSDPTANRAIYNVDERAELLEALRKEERELEQLIGESLVIIAAVRDGFGEIYALLLERRYIDCNTWTRIHDDCGIVSSSGKYLLNIAFDWIDSVGVSRLLNGEVEI